MKIPSCTHPFAVFLALSVITFHPSFAISVDSKDAILQPRLDGSAVTSGPDTSTSPTRRRKKRSITPASGKESAAANAYSTGTAPSASVVTGSLVGFSRSNASTLASHLPYSRSSPCKPKAGTIYLPSPSSTHSPMASATDQESPEGSTGASWTPLSSTYMANTNENGGSGLTIAGNGSPLPLGAPTASNGIPSSNENADSGTIAPSPTGGSPGTDKGFPGSSESGDNSLPAAGSGNPLGRLTWRLQTSDHSHDDDVIYRHHSQVAEAGNSAGATNAAVSSPSSINGAAATASTAINRAVPSSLAANASTGRRRTKCGKVTRTVVASIIGIGSLYGIGTQGSPLERVAISPKVPVHLLRRLPLSPLTRPHQHPSPIL